ncbi:MAG TPA: hypothetical protein VNZ52_11895 [Candidatus Thermoplasmatota archaeon]|nr:hypothetical protein [Candidatus Thermoplasmatota archaeon]
MFLYDGSPPAIVIGPGAEEHRPLVEEWALTVKGTGQLLCTINEPCGDAAKEAALAGEGCGLSVRMWLSATHRAVVVEEVNLTGFASGMANRTTFMQEFEVPWDGGAWWRMEEERVAFRVPIPCDTQELSLTVNGSGRTVTNSRASFSQSVDLQLV